MSDAFNDLRTRKINAPVTLQLTTNFNETGNVSLNHPSGHFIGINGAGNTVTITGTDPGFLLGASHLGYISGMKIMGTSQGFSLNNGARIDMITDTVLDGFGTGFAISNGSMVFQMSVTFTNTENALIISNGSVVNSSALQPIIFGDASPNQGKVRVSNGSTLIAPYSIDIGEMLVELSSFALLDDSTIAGNFYVYLSSSCSVQNCTGVGGSRAVVLTNHGSALHFNTTANMTFTEGPANGDGLRGTPLLIL